MSDTIIEGTYEECKNGVVVLSNGSVLTNPFWTIKRLNEMLIQKAVRDTEERIIKLLDEYSHIEGVALAVALIKGEQK